MFRTASPYSPFFTSGLLSESTSACSDRCASDTPLGPRRGSLPTDAPPTRTGSSPKAKSTDQSSAFYFTLQPRRDTVEYRSFLSLDLAESQSLRSVSLKHKASCLTKSSMSSIPEKALFPKHSLPNKGLAPPPSPLRLRTSRDSLRTIPSPKPAPSTTLPDLPSPTSSRSDRSLPPRLPAIPHTPSLRFSTMHRASHSAPSLVISRTVAPPNITPLPKRISHTPSASMSSVSTGYRKVKRSDALAALEGRSNPSRRVSHKRGPTQRNFMSMSDDEDDEAESDSDVIREVDENEDKSFISTLYDDETASLPSGAKSAPVTGAFFASTPTLASPPRSRRHKRRSTTEWFPLKSFIDLRDDDISRWSWRSFIEVAVS